MFTTPNDLSKGSESYKNVNWNLVDDPGSNEVKKVKEVYKGRYLPLRVCDPSRMTIGYLYPGWVENNSTLRNEVIPIISVSFCIYTLAIEFSSPLTSRRRV